MCCFMFAKRLVWWIDLTKGLYIYEKSFEMCICVWPEFDCPEVTLCSWQDIKIRILTNSLLPQCAYLTRDGLSRTQKKSSVCEQPRAVVRRVQSFQDCISYVKTWMTAIKLKLNDAKSESQLMESNRTHPDPHPTSVLIANIDTLLLLLLFFPTGRQSWRDTF